jgi:hypothetical protein
MRTLVINISDDVNIIDLSMQLQRLYPSLQIVDQQITAEPPKKFSGIDDLKTLYVPNFRMCSREELYDR